ncbi:MAG: YhbY family RNA-binding protein [Candidatus Lokiarchaeota archaeon]|nr:YhbY family RNA-binding protein [Candidatus Lokiarchaeota archaeon]
MKSAFHDPVDVQLGKGGITDTVIEHIKELLKTKNPLKIKVLKNAISEDTYAEYYAREVSKRVHAKLVGIRGNTFVIGRGTPENAARSGKLRWRRGAGQ